jgi:hypothetical protein
MTYMVKTILFKIGFVIYFQNSSIHSFRRNVPELVGRKADI